MGLPTSDAIYRESKLEGNDNSTVVTKSDQKTKTRIKTTTKNILKIGIIMKIVLIQIIFKYLIFNYINTIIIYPFQSIDYLWNM